jgi:HK97 family phage major capsid protein
MPVLAALAQAYWVAGDTGLKQTSEVSWGKAQLVAEELAAIVPCPEAVIDDAGFDLWGEVRTELTRAVARTLDMAALAGIDRPPT